MANVGSGAAGQTLIGAGNGKSPTYASIGTNSGLTAHGVVVAENLGAFTALNPGNVGFVLTSNGTGSDPSFQSLPSSGISTITGNSGGAQSPTAGNFNILGTGSITVAGTAATETVQLTGLTNHNMLVGAGTATITNVAPSATSGIPLVSNGSSADPSFTTAVVAGGGTGQTTFPDHSILIGAVTAALRSLSPGATGTLLRSNGASSDPGYTTATYPTTAGTSGNLITSNGTNFVSVGPQASTKVTTFNSNGTWTIDPRAISVEFFVWGAGGGGGSGRSGSSGQSGGGGGGAGGNLAYLKSYASILTASPYTVTVGTGGTGGTAATNANGNPGIIGGTTSVGSIIVVPGGSPGGAGVNGGTGSVSSLYYNLNALIGSSAPGLGSNTQGGTPSALVYGWSTGGGGGSGYTAVTPRSGGVGGAITGADATTLVAGGLAGDNTGATAGNGNATATQLIVGATGGGGGGNDGVTTAGTGGNGAQPGGGGGGGSGNVSTNASGAGGNGGNGKVIIIEYF